MVARAAPETPIPNKNINMGSRTIFAAAPMNTVIIPTDEKPWELMKGLRPRDTMENTVPARYIRI